MPLSRIGTESEFSAAVVDLLSPAAACVTGTCLRVDGGAPTKRQSWTADYPTTNLPEFNGFHRAVLPKILNNSR